MQVVRDISPPNPDDVPLLTDEELIRNPERRPDWYHPNFSSSKVRIYYGEQCIPFVINPAALGNINLNKASLTEALQYLSLASVMSNQEDPRMFQPQIDPQVIRRAQARPPQEAPAGTLLPTKGIKVRMEDAPFGITLYFHEIFVNEPFIVLAFHTACTGVPVPDLDPGVRLRVVLLENNTEYLVQSLGLVFSHNSFNYYILLQVQRSAQTPEQPSED